MPHYKNGDAAKIGDVVKCPRNGETVIGAVRTINPGAETCNMEIQVFASIHEGENSKVVLKGEGIACGTISEFERVH